ncbi:NAD-dependent epimerase/dehydratase family protein [Kribbella sp. VKM Ac-2566]|uniref:NAD-dependent epimerase/dehydratase family protein n=1 Tax=Kribbella sp. VKM Ac-2566 TaxID=2512218 RepID=UPI001062FD07|nr:NAD-dependent epimerase/dehydratase family protein [Kribbella sp. VKM Ac-2566]TDW88847.1 nucleoside-diphosphate-sugar epimerase [Kribbella sp. VKM Ac-2566]
MRIAILGGTRFIGRAVVERLAAEGHTLLVVHRGDHEPDDLVPVEHAHVDRHDGAALAVALKPFDPEALVDISGMNAAAADAALGAVGPSVKLVAISSCDVYRAYDGLHSDRTTDALPLTEESPLRDRRFVDGPEYENLEVEERYLPRGATVLRLGAVYGEHDYQRRFEFVLRRVRAGRRRIPVGSGQFLFSRVYVGDVAAAVSLALGGDFPGAFNVVEPAIAPYRLFAEQILAAAGAEDTELVRVRDDLLPSDLSLTGAIDQHLLMDPWKARTVLGWTPVDPAETLRASVRWHLAHPPADAADDFSEDDAVLD